MTAAKPGRGQALSLRGRRERPATGGLPPLHLPGSKFTSRGRGTDEGASRPEGCVHHWVIETPRGTSHCEGVCKRCGATKPFRVAYDEDFFRTTGAALQMDGAA